MKTTLVIDDHVFRLAKQSAAARDTTLSEIVNQSLRAYLHASAPSAAVNSPFIMPVYPTADAAGRSSSATPAELAELRDDGR